ncbi:MAG: hypothetical protein KDC28_09630 [Saprospiraceae bacterium]|nr:hypothetical protein [Saprospiraceae bacterium]MCB9318079.1 hypothetical protein [Lewinellaceae bacterium]
MKGIFSSLRHQLIKSGKTRAYGWYAFGEILLIVVGILIALGIDNWNEERKERRTEQYFLSGLKEEFTVNKIRLENLIAVVQDISDASEEIEAYLSGTVDTLSEKSLSRKLYRALAYDIIYNPNQSLLNEVTGYGKLNLITSMPLRQVLMGWQPFIQQIRLQESGLRQNRNEILDLLSSEKGSIRTIFNHISQDEKKPGSNSLASRESNKMVVHTPAFENKLLIYLLTANNTGSMHYKPLLTEINQILELIDQEIKE